MSSRHPEITGSDRQIKHELRRRTRRDFLVGGIVTVAGVAGYKWITKAKQENGVPWPQRRVLDWNGRIARAYLSDSHLMPTYSPDKVEWLKPNGAYGLQDPIDAGNWKLHVSSDQAPQLSLALSLSDIQSLPKVELITRFCCIEGWSTIVHWGGIRFADFTRKFFPPGAPLTRYVYLSTPDEEYYVGLDTKSAMHPQTLLAYEHNGSPLTNEHGAPLRLVIPVKYGIKNIKRIGAIQYTNTQPSDYWAEEGYDWFAGL